MSNPPIEFLSGKEESRKTIINHAPMALHTFAISASSSSPCEIRNFSLEMHRMKQQGKQINWLLKYHQIESRLISNQNWYDVLSENSHLTTTVRRWAKRNPNHFERFTDDTHRNFEVCSFSCASTKNCNLRPRLRSKRKQFSPIHR